MNTHWINLRPVVLALCIFCAASQSNASGLRDSARVSAGWALTHENPQALADSIALYLREGGNLEPGDPFSALPLIDGLRTLPGGDDLADSLIAMQPRGQFGGAPRVDLVLAPGQTHEVGLTLVADEITWIEARLWRGSAGADIDLELRGEDGHVIAGDYGPDTGTEGAAALLEVHTVTCTNATLHVVNSGSTKGRVAILIPQSLRPLCGDPG